MPLTDSSEFRLQLPDGTGTATGRVLDTVGNNGSREFRLNRGSAVSGKEWQGIAEYARRRRAALRADGTLVDSTRWPGQWETATDVDCNSSSAAASIVLGYSASGPTSWRNADGHQLADFLKPSWRAPHKSWLVRGSNVSGRDLVRRLWLPEGFVSLSGAHLPQLEEPDPTKSALRRYVQGGYEGTASYHQKRGLVDELHAFVTQMRIGDTVATLSDGNLYIGEITSEAVQNESPGSLSNLRRTVTWQQKGHAYEELPEGLQQRLSLQHDVIDLTNVADTLTELAPSPPVADIGDLPTETAPRELTLPPTTAALAGDLLLHDPAWLDDVRELLWDERQLVFYGPPGTGKTYLAMKLAEHFGGGPEQVTLVQFHPSYAYEDFFEGFRPEADPDSGEVAFRLKAGPLRELADLAQREGNQHIPHFLIIDEINRANLAKVFGELYFLLEYRKRSVRLTYSGDDFTLPPNLFIIGTMNTADRSIALVDTAMRRRFAFVELSPRTEPTRGLLSRWLHRHGHDQEPARLLDTLNERIGGEEFAIGPSYLMKPSVHREGGLDRTWRTKILPLLEEHHYGEGMDIERRYGLTTLRKSPS
ncbi:DUF4357 domain-containing protein [Streptomyces luteolus]|uniref:DUF4357 domain-containing protein n=1 Tax=Streptomyces luteolus TaxID=3043615 RepID=A0ABT6SX05_9ACTN|nr:DUF4357 domain-containing protein [Streptomyces sp. B-S-A12]MDI3420133.1 DUF4357 domain-containing protein [Streptomyces sp. B-S-A12]